MFFSFAKVEFLKIRRENSGPLCTENTVQSQRVFTEFATEKQLLLQDIKADDLISQGRKCKAKRHRLNLQKEEIYPMVKMRGNKSIEWLHCCLLKLSQTSQMKSVVGKNFCFLLVIREGHHGGHNNGEQKSSHS